jgi:hypothetical protein
MFLEVKDFGAAHRELFPEGTTGSEAFAELSDAIARIDAQEQARPLAAIDGQKERAVARQAMQEAMREIALTAKGIKGGSSQAARLTLPRGKSMVAWMQAVPAFIQQAETIRAQLCRMGLPATCIDDLRAHAEALKQTMEGRRTGRRGVTQASSETKKAFRRARVAIRTLDIVVHNAVKGDETLTAVWDRCREVAGMAKTKRAAEIVEPAEPVVEPATTPEPVIAPVGDVASDPLKVAS